jgi:hypothetical protein
LSHYFIALPRLVFSCTSIKDYVTPEQIADRILFLCSPRGKTISGQAISICGDTQMPGQDTLLKITAADPGAAADARR